MYRSFQTGRATQQNVNFSRHWGEVIFRMSGCTPPHVIPFTRVSTTADRLLCVSTTTLFRSRIIFDVWDSLPSL